jgi:hypothetical protein
LASGPFYQESVRLLTPCLRNAIQVNQSFWMIKTRR